MTISAIETDWDYRRESTDALTHGIHPYPAKMVPQVAARLIAEYGSECGLLFDPYCGSGTSLLEANLAGMDAVGTDLNPLARLISRVKTTVLPLDAIDALIWDFERGDWLDRECGKRSHELDVFNLEYWFSGDAVAQLQSIHSFVSAIGDKRLMDFARVAFSMTVREASWTKKSEFKLVRLPREQLESVETDAHALMMRALVRNRNAMAALAATVDESFGDTHVLSFDTVRGIPPSSVVFGSADLIVTSPPYGDSQTTVAYGQFSRFSNQWLGFNGVKSLDTELMGGRRAGAYAPFGIERIDSVLERIGEVDGRRAADVASFFRDYSRSIANVATVLRSSGTACYVVGNRTVRGVTIPTDEITVALFELNGFKFVRSHTRNIPNKRMPYANSPSNVAGATSPTIRRETVIVCQKL